MRGPSLRSPRRLVRFIQDDKWGGDDVGEEAQSRMVRDLEFLLTFFAVFAFFCG
jgi:hypothetical protein